jgi:hypothetical protein
MVFLVARLDRYAVSQEAVDLPVRVVQAPRPAAAGLIELANSLVRQDLIDLPWSSIRKERRRPSSTFLLLSRSPQLPRYS